MGAADRLLFGLTFAGLACALALGNPWLAAAQAAAAGVYFLGGIIHELLSPTPAKRESEDA